MKKEFTMSIREIVKETVVASITVSLTTSLMDILNSVFINNYSFFILNLHSLGGKIIILPRRIRTNAHRKCT